MNINIEDLQKEAEKLFGGTFYGRDHVYVLEEILNNLDPMDFAEQLSSCGEEKLTKTTSRILVIEKIFNAAKQLDYGICINDGFLYIYNGMYWKLKSKEELETFLGDAAERLGVNHFTAADYKFRNDLVKQFNSFAYIPKPASIKNKVIINLLNGTGEVTNAGFKIRGFESEDFLTYQLPFKFESDADCPKWKKFLNDVLPEPSSQMVLAEFFGYVFAKDLKLEKVLILYGGGANGKSVCFEVVAALLGGKENVSNISLESLGKTDYYRAMLANKLLNYASEISTRLNTTMLKQLASGEPLEARLPYSQPFTLENYARLAFNCNELPKSVEHTEAFFRRFLIIPFEKTIPEDKRNPNLARNIIDTELPGVFNWVVDGLNRLLENQKFTECRAIRETIKKYRFESDSVAMFIHDEHYVRSNSELVKASYLFGEYRAYCIDNGYRHLGRNNFIKRVEALGYSRQDSYQSFFYLEREKR